MARTGIILFQVVFVLAIVAVWQLATSFGEFNPMMLPSPAAVFLAAVGLLNNSSFLGNVVVTTMRVLSVFAISVPLSLVAGFIIAERPGANRTLGPLIYFFLGVPKSVFLPIYTQIFGVASLQKIVFGLSQTFFILTSTTIAAVQTVDPRQVLLARSVGAGKMRIYRSIYFPSVLPALLNGIRITAVFSVSSVLIAEMFASQAGIGQMIVGWSDQFQTDILIAVVILISLFSIILNEVLGLLQGRVAEHGHKYVK